MGKSRVTQSFNPAEDVYVQNRRVWVRLHEKGGKRHEMPCHHNLEAYLHAYIDGCGLAGDPKGPLFRTIGRGNPSGGAAPSTAGRRSFPSVQFVKQALEHSADDTQALAFLEERHREFLEGVIIQEDTDAPPNQENAD
jgi:hypothetical protein